MNLIAHVEIPTRDIERAMRFYSEVFGVSFGETVEIHGSRMAFFPFKEGNDGASGALAQGEVYVPTLDGAVVYFSVANIDDAISKAIALGSDILFPKTSVDGHLFVAEIADSEGNRIALMTT
ncbi:glyoxalase [Rhizobium sp. Root1203]|uniref:VOC family protein n=1 Tax=Rhizobium sp. Root1203 TaxID=1736427 RepID=UPI00070B8B11|nr:VOC family protein [Rhizobium sp. Root1203]KQV32468.1 glyoxalase [Rhizobium sp. Root1203]